MTTSFNVVSAFPLTPTSADGTVDTAAMKRLIALLVAAKVDSIGPLGSTGSYPYLSRVQRRRATNAALGKPMARSRYWLGLGRDAPTRRSRWRGTRTQRVPPLDCWAPVSYTPLTDAEVFEHVSALASAGGLPICIYGNYATTHFRCSPELIGLIALILMSWR